jgi:hypothetical protein
LRERLDADGSQWRRISRKAAPLRQGRVALSFVYQAVAKPGWSSFPMSSEEAELNEKVQKGLLDCLTGKRAVHVSMKREAGSKK